MKWDDIFNALTQGLETPKTVEEALAYIGQDPVCQTTIDDLAFKQVVLNILVAAGIVSETDFNRSINQFKGMIAQSFAENLLKKMGQENIQVIINTEEEPEPDEEINLDSADNLPKA